MSANEKSNTSADGIGRVNGVAAAKLRRRLRVVIYARYSIEEQDASSIADQFAYCQDYVKTIGIIDAVITRYQDEGVSGELRNRAGVDQIWQGIKKPEWDLLIVEDCSRLFRNSSACIELVETAFDAGMRFIAINDDLDTTKNGWEERLKEAAGDHAKSHQRPRQVRIFMFDAIYAKDHPSSAQELPQNRCAVEDEGGRNHGAAGLPAPPHGACFHGQACQRPVV